MMKSSADRIIPIVTGPTAVGKTDLTLRLAERFDAEIISCDSRQVYRRLTIGTAKPNPSELERVRHHFIDELDPSEPFSAGIFSRAAEDRMSRLLSENTLPIVTGGSTLYLQALISGLAQIPEVDPDVRKTLNQRLETSGAQCLYDELVSVDPEYSATLDPTKSQRIIRGLEVYYGTGTPLSEYFSKQLHPRFRYNLVVLNRARENLYDRINRRVIEMVDSGLIDEVSTLLSEGFDESSNALRTIGYQEVFAHLRGELGREEMTCLIQRNTRRYAKRQLTWFRRYPTAIWVDLDRESDAKVLKRLENLIEKNYDL